MKNPLKEVFVGSIDKSIEQLPEGQCYVSRGEMDNFILFELEHNSTYFLDSKPSSWGPRTVQVEVTKERDDISYIIFEKSLGGVEKNIEKADTKKLKSEFDGRPRELNIIQLARVAFALQWGVSKVDKKKHHKPILI